MPRKQQSKGSRDWCFTLNNYTETDIQHLQNVDVKYIVFGKEVGEQGTPHLQGFIAMQHQKTLSAMKKAFSATAHFEERQGTFASAINYCKKGTQSKDEWKTMGDKGPNFGKDADIYESGIAPLDPADKGELGKIAIQQRWELAIQGKFTELPPENIRTYEYIFNKYHKVEKRNKLINYWVYGETECGKSSGVRKQFPDHYIKGMNKWWCGYRHQAATIIDDMDPSHVPFMKYFLKIWGDHYVFVGETKGGNIDLRPKILIVTSQYTLEECFGNDRDCDALKRRFTQIHVERDVPIQWPNIDMDVPLLTRGEGNTDLPREEQKDTTEDEDIVDF